MQLVSSRPRDGAADRTREQDTRAPVPPAALHRFACGQAPAVGLYLRRLAELPAGLVQRVGAHRGRLVCILLGNSAQRARASKVTVRWAAKGWKAAAVIMHAAARPVGRRDRGTVHRHGCEEQHHVAARTRHWIMKAHREHGGNQYTQEPSRQRGTQEPAARHATCLDRCAGRGSVSVPGSTEDQEGHQEEGLEGRTMCVEGVGVLRQSSDSPGRQRHLTRPCRCTCIRPCLGYRRGMMHFWGDSFSPRPSAGTTAAVERGEGPMEPAKTARILARRNRNQQIS